MWPLISPNNVDWSATGAMLAAWAAIGVFFASQYWSMKNYRAQAQWRMADLKMATLDRVVLKGSELVALLNSFAMLSEVGQIDEEQHRVQVRELEELKLQLMLEIEKYGEGANDLRIALASLVKSKSPSEIQSSSVEIMKLFSGLVSIEMEAIAFLTNKRVAWP